MPDRRDRRLVAASADQPQGRPPRVWVQVHDSSDPKDADYRHFPPVIVYLDLSDGTAKPTGVTLDASRRITPAELRGLPWRDILDTASGGAAAMLPAIELPPAKPRGRVPLPDSHYDEVLDLYARAEGEMPTRPYKWLQAHFDRRYNRGEGPYVSTQTLRRWVREARRRQRLREGMGSP
jgi:hypothetical protein